jgi:hypothetical protein
MKKGTRAKRYAAYKYTVKLHTQISKTNLGLNPHAGYTCNHIIPVSRGFALDIDPAIIGSEMNLEFVPYQENIQQGSRITADSIRVMRASGLDDLADIYEAKIK